MAANAAPPPRQEAFRVPVIEEQLAVGTRTVDTGGGVRIHKTVSEQPVVIDEALLREEVEVRHVAVDRIVAADEVPAARHEGDTLIIPILEEVLLLERRLRIKEELHITRHQRHQRHAETVMLKSEQVSVERFDGSAGPPSE